jgi:uncharacterized protein YegJ (DUF2314 family)
MRVLSIALCAALIGLAACNKQPAVAEKAENNDALLNAASAEARATLPQFWAIYDAKDPSRTDFAINAKMPASGGTEIIWVNVTERHGSSITGVLALEPDHMPDQHKGDRVVVEDKDVQDWGYTRGDKIYGNYFMRAMLPKLPESQRAELTAQLAANPTEQAAP